MFLFVMLFLGKTYLLLHQICDKTCHTAGRNSSPTSSSLYFNVLFFCLSDCLKMILTSAINKRVKKQKAFSCYKPQLYQTKKAATFACHINNVERHIKRTAKLCPFNSAYITMRKPCQHQGNKNLTNLSEVIFFSRRYH